MRKASNKPALKIAAVQAMATPITSDRASPNTRDRFEAGSTTAGKLTHACSPDGLSSRKAPGVHRTRQRGADKRPGGASGGGSLSYGVSSESNSLLKAQRGSLVSTEMP